MWRSYVDVVLYLYHLDQAEDQGNDVFLSTRLKPGRWHYMKQTVRVNDSNQANGSIRVWIDAEQVLDRSGLQLQTDDQALVDAFSFSTFFGGSGAEWAPKNDTSIEFARRRVYTTEALTPR